MRIKNNCGNKQTIPFYFTADKTLKNAKKSVLQYQKWKESVPQKLRWPGFVCNHIFWMLPYPLYFIISCACYHSLVCYHIFGILPYLFYVNIYIMYYMFVCFRIFVYYHIFGMLPYCSHFTYFLYDIMFLYVIISSVCYHIFCLLSYI